MLFLLATVAFLQSLLLPGLLAVGLLRLRPGPLRGLILCFGLGGLLNYGIVAALTLCGVFGRSAAFAVLALEAILLLYVWRREIPPLLKASPLRKAGESLGSWLKGFCAWMDGLDPFMRAFAIAAAAGAAFSLAVSLHELLASAGTIFDAWDAVLSWNRWARDWQANMLPRHTYDYPQLVPTNWALCYQIMGEPLQCVPKITVGLYPLFMLFMLFDLGVSRKSPGIMASVPLLAWLFRNVEFGRFGGDVDLAVTFMGLLSCYCAMQAEAEKDGGNFWRWLLAGSLTACGAAATKQSGIFILALYPLLAFLLLKGKLKELSFGRGRIAKAAALHFALALLIAAPFYAYSRSKALRGIEKSNIEFVTKSIYGGRSHAERFVIASKMFLARLELGGKDVKGARWAKVEMDKGLAGIVDFYRPYGLFAVASAALTVFLLGLSLAVPLARWPLAVIFAPYALIWSVFYCYDLRNLALALPFLALALGSGLEEAARRWGAKLSKLPAWAFLAALLAAALAVSLLFSGSSLRVRQLRLQREIGDPAINKRLYEYHDASPIKMKIATDYEFIDYLPGLEGLVRYEEFSDQTEGELKRYLEALADPELGFLLVPNYTMRPIQEDVRKRLESGEMEQVFYESGVRFIRLVRKEARPAEGKSEER